MRYKPQRLPNCPGIYAITHVASGRRYIGSAKKILNRCRVHRSYLRNGKHFSRHLQNAWNKYGEDAFVFEVVETCLDSHVLLLAREQHWIDRYSGMLFNHRLVAESTEGCKLNLSEEDREIRRQTAKANFTRCPRPPQTNAKLSADMIPGIFARYASGETSKSIAKDLGVGIGAVQDILRRHTWAEIDIQPDVVAACRTRLDDVGRKLSNDQVREIRRRLSTGEPCASVARDFPVSVPVVGRIKRGTSYAAIA